MCHRGEPLRAGALSMLLLGACCGFIAPVAASGSEVRGRVLGTDGQPVSGAVVFVETPPPGAAEPPTTARAVMDQINKEFVPGVLPVVVGTEVSFPNHDQIHHHVYSFSRTKTFEIPLYKGEGAPPVRFDNVGAVKIGCNIHDWMSAVILVLPTPYFTTTGDDGGFVLRDLPAGSSVLAAWHERSRTAAEDSQRRIDLEDEPVELSFTLDLAPLRARPRSDGMRQYE